MIYPDDTKQFASIMKVTWQSFGRNNLDKDTMRYWFDKLSKHELISVERAFDEWIKSQKELPTVSEILKLCQHKVSIHARLPSPLAIADNREHAKDVMDYVAKNIKPKRNYRAWAEKIIASPSKYPDISLKLAKEALSMKEVYA